MIKNGISQNPGSPGAKPQVAVLFHRLGPYHHARLRAAGEAMEVTGVEFSNVDTMYDWELLDEANGFKRVRLFSGEAVHQLSADRLVKRLDEVLNEIRPQVVAIPGWSDRCSLAAMRWCCFNGVPTVMMSETTAWDFQRHWLKEAVKRRLLKLCGAGLVGGRAHAEYLQLLGFSPSNIFTGYDAVDNHHFSANTAELRHHAPELRSQHQLPENFFLASARFVPKKNLSRLIQAYSDYRKAASHAIESSGQGELWDLVLLGDGPLRGSLEAEVTALGLSGHVMMPGFKQYDELPIFYALARVFVHASTTEQWGLVVNEAMASGLPVIVSNRCGCVHELVEEGVNGYRFDPMKVEQLAQLMFCCTQPSTDLSAMAQAAQNRVSEWGVERFGSGLKQAVEAAMNAAKPSATFLNWLQIKLLLSQKERMST
jgi:glycosyltransferase involved in cell wall biosynthesis